MIVPIFRHAHTPTNSTRIPTPEISIPKKGLLKSFAQAVGSIRRKVYSLSLSLVSEERYFIFELAPPFNRFWLPRSLRGLKGSFREVLMLDSLPCGFRKLRNGFSLSRVQTKKGRDIIFVQRKCLGPLKLDWATHGERLRSCRGPVREASAGLPRLRFRVGPV